MKPAIRFLLAFAPGLALAQVTPADYERARTLRDKFQGLAVNIPWPVNWIEKTDRFWYRKTVKGGAEFVVVDAATQTKKPAFDHAQLATSLSAATGTAIAPLAFPFSEIFFVDGESGPVIVSERTKPWATANPLAIVNREMTGVRLRALAVTAYTPGSTMMFYGPVTSEERFRQPQGHLDAPLVRASFIFKCNG